MKNTGPEIDKALHQKMLKSFVDFIDNFSPVLHNAEEYKMHLTFENLIDENEETLAKLETINEINTLLNNLFPNFIKFAALEDKLERLNK